MKKYMYYPLALLFVPWTACNNPSAENTKLSPLASSPTAEMILPNVPDTTLPSGRKNVYLLRSRDQEGMFVERTTFPKGYVAEPHVHNGPLYVTILKGSAHVSFSDKVDTTIQHRPYGPGSFFVVPADQPHYEWFTEECVMQIEGVGPINTFYVTKDSASQQ